MSIYLLILLICMLVIRYASFCYELVCLVTLNFNDTIRDMGYLLRLASTIYPVYTRLLVMSIGKG